MPTNYHILELKNISQAYGSVNQRFVALEDLNLIIDEGNLLLY